MVVQLAASRESTEDAERLDIIELINRDIRAAAKLLTPAEARFLVRQYYDVQEMRIRSNAQVRESSETGEPSALVVGIARHFEAGERKAREALQGYAEDHEVGRWSMSIIGIGPVIAAGLVAHIDIEKAPTVGHIWRFAGLDPTVKWGKGEKRPWNADLKTLCWKLGESFVKTSGHEREVYGTVYRERKEREQERNEAGMFAEQAARSLAEKKYRADTVARQWYDQGKLPPARIHLRAERYAVKLFLAHFHHVAYEIRYGVPPPKPYILEHDPAHTHFKAPPNWPMS